MTTPRTLFLGSVLAKLGRAHEHSQTVKSEIRNWRDGNPYMITREHNADFTRHILVAHIADEPPIVRWSLIVGDVVHNLRAALDHLVYAIAILESKGQVPPPGANVLTFPVCNCSDSFKEALGRIKTLSTPVRTAIEECQPYHRKHPDLPPLLSILNEFEKTDKHKLVRLAFSSVAEAKVGFVGKPPKGAVVKNFANAGEIKDGAEIVAYTCSQSAPDMKFDRFDLIIIVALWHGAGPNGIDRTDVPSLLTLLNKEVRDVIDKVSNVALR